MMLRRIGRGAPSVWLLCLASVVAVSACGDSSPSDDSVPTAERPLARLSDSPNAGSDRDACAHGCSVGYSHSNAVADTYCHASSDSHCHIVANSYLHAVSDSHCHIVANSYLHAVSDYHSIADANPY